MLQTVTNFARRIVGLADGEAEKPTESIVHRLAERLQRQERVAGGWATEVGGLPTEAFEGEAERLVQAISLGGTEGGAPPP